MSAKREYAWGKVTERTFFSLSWECKMKLGLREKRIRTDEQFRHGIRTMWEMGSHSFPHFTFSSSLRESQTYHWNKWGRNTLWEDYISLAMLPSFLPQSKTLVK